MKITLTRSGGVANIRRQLTLDLDACDAAERDELGALVDRANFFALPPAVRGNFPDAFQYTIEVDRDGHRHSVTAGERSAPRDLQPLLSRLIELMRHKA